MSSKLKFVGIFLLVFALVASLFAATGAPSFYAAMLRATAGFVGPVTSGWWIDVENGANGPETWLHKGQEKLLFRISLESLALALIPLFSLITATGLSLRRWLPATLLGFSGLYSLHLLVVLAYPFLVSQTAVADIVGEFLGLIAFVAGPVILWFVVTFDELRTVWRLDGGAMEGRGSRNED